MDLREAGPMSAEDVTYTSITIGEMICCVVVTNSFKNSDIQGKRYCGEILQMVKEYARVYQWI